jgi:uncharacterized damage-inducible protein DinB
MRPHTGAPDSLDLVRFVDSAFAGPAWHGPSLRASVRGLSADEASWRPAPDRHSAWELVLHTAYAKHRVVGRLDRALATRFARRLARPWWPSTERVAGAPKSAADAWREDLELLDASHRRLIDTLAALPPGRLGQSRRGSSFTFREEVAGTALHDVYHAGQILLLRRLSAGRPPSQLPRPRRRASR